MKYVVSGYIGFDNFGDEAIAHVLTQKLKKEGAEKITLISSNPSKTAKIHQVESCGMLNFFKPLMDTDVLISGGGSLLQDVTSIKSLIYYLMVIQMGLLLGKRVEIFAQGIGPINSNFGKFFTKFLLKNVHYISVRDKKSQELLSSWGIESTLVNDPIFDLDIQPLNIKGIVGIQLRNCPAIEQNPDFVHKLAKVVSDKFSDKSFKILSLQDSYDSQICHKFKNYLREYGITNVEVKEKLSIDEVIKEIQTLEYLIGMRFHANVIGIKAGVKTAAINYDPKVEKLSCEYNLPLIEIKNENIEEKFQELLN